MRCSHTDLVLLVLRLADTMDSLWLVSVSCFCTIQIGHSSHSMIFLMYSVILAFTYQCYWWRFSGSQCPALKILFLNRLGASCTQTYSPLLHRQILQNAGRNLFLVIEHRFDFWSPNCWAHWTDRKWQTKQVCRGDGSGRETVLFAWQYAALQITSTVISEMEIVSNDLCYLGMTESFWL